MSLILVIARLLELRTELQIAEHFFEQSALSDLPGVNPAKINEDRLYRALDALLPHKLGLSLPKHLEMMKCSEDFAT